MANQSMPQLESLINDKYRNERLAQELENAFLRSGKKLRDDCDPYHNKELGLALNGENIVPHAVRDELSVYIADGNVSWEEKARKLRKAHLRLVDRTHQAMAALHSVTRGAGEALHIQDTYTKLENATCSASNRAKKALSDLPAHEHIELERALERANSTSYVNRCQTEEEKRLYRYDVIASNILRTSDEIFPVTGI